MIAAHAVLLLVPAAERQRLVAEYVDRNDGSALFSPTDNAPFLEFLALRLPDPSHALSLCQMELAMTHARLGSEMFVEPEYRPARGCNKRQLRRDMEAAAWGCIERAVRASVATKSWDHIERNSWDSVESAVWDSIEREARGRIESEAWQFVERSARYRIERGPHASLVWFHAEPEAVLRTLHGAVPPPVGAHAHAVLFAPGLPNLCRAATPREAEFWASLPAGDTEPELVERLLAEGVVVYTE